MSCLFSEKNQELLQKKSTCDRIPPIRPISACLLAGHFMEMNPIYIGDLNPSAQQYSRIESEDGLELEELREVSGDASSCRPKALLAVTLLCCLLLSSNVVLLNLYIKQSRMTQEALQNETKLWKYETFLSHNNTALGDEIDELSRRNADLQNKTLALLDTETVLRGQNENLTQRLDLCWAENGALSAINTNLTASNGALRGHVELLTGLNRRLQGRIANLSHSENELLETNADLASTDAKLLQWVKDLEALEANLTSEVARKSAEEHDLALQYATLEKHCHTILPSFRDHGHHHHHQITSNNDLTGKSMYFPYGVNGYVTFQPEQVGALSSFTICLTHSADLYWEVSLLPPAGQGDMAHFQCLSHHCWVSLHRVSRTIQVSDMPRQSTGWNHTCLTWRADSAMVHLWLNGVGDQGHRESKWGTEQLVGSIVLRQNGGSGMVTNLHVWNHVLSSCEIRSLSAGLSTTSGNVLNWANLMSWQPSQSQIQLTPQENMCRASY
ncbi:uncharacterized protein LOC108941742 [Scleropages formosus]|uniref:uncharacterized protein LOC108941742 n=1 Tax=Scleropages formosus TaxID=113540 RepID=UPI000878BA51|nr:uncharacterized protein LOC108941742 [Scleropages formosus]